MGIQVYCISNWFSWRKAELPGTSRGSLCQLHCSGERLWHETFVSIDVTTLVDQVEWKNCSVFAGTESEIEMGAE